MRLPVKRGWSRYTVGDGFELTLWVQPWHLWLWAKIYHRYDMLFFRIPGVKAFERWQQHRHKHTDLLEEFCDRCIPLTNRQDLRCHYLTHRRRVELARVTVTEEVYNKLKGHDE